MEVSISCDKFVRLANIARSKEHSDDLFFLRSIYICSKNNHQIAISTNRKIAAIELISRKQMSDGSFMLNVEDSLLNQCETEKTFNSNLHLIHSHELSFTSAKSDLGYQHQGNAAILDNGKYNPFHTWTEWFPDQLPSESNGGIFANLHSLKLLAASAPSGSILFPEFIDNKKPVMMKDVHDPDWIGLFIPNIGEQSRSVEPFAIPDWVK